MIHFALFLCDVLLALGNAELSGLVGSVQKLTVDGRRTGMTPVQCDAACVNNNDTIASS